MSRTFWQNYYRLVTPVQTWCIQVTTSNKYIRTHQSLIVRLNCSSLAGAILLQILFGLHITFLFNIHGHLSFK